MRRKHFWAVCYGHVCRWSGADSPQQAAQWTFGVAPGRCTVEEFPANPKYMPQYKRAEFLEALYKRHKEATGEEIKG